MDPPSNAGRTYDLGQRTTEFAKAIIKFAKSVKRSPVNNPLISQIVRSGTSIGANYGEADDAETNKRFRYLIAICQREARETKYWLQLLVSADEALKETAAPLWREAKELHLIFCAILKPKP